MIYISEAGGADVNQSVSYKAILQEFMWYQTHLIMFGPRPFFFLCIQKLIYICCFLSILLEPIYFFKSIFYSKVDSIISLHVHPFG